MDDLFLFLKNEKLNPLIRSCVFTMNWIFFTRSKTGMEGSAASGTPSCSTTTILPSS